jgi:hypothetical protein
VTAQAANGKVTWDLEAAAAADGAAGEANADPFPFAYKGQTYSIPPMSEWPVSALRAVGRGDFDAALPVLLGDEATEALCDAGLKIGELTTLFDRVAQESGMMAGLPNPPGPAPGSSRQPARRNSRQK